MSQYFIVQKWWMIYLNYLPNCQKLPTIMKPSLVLRVPRDQGFCNPALYYGFHFAKDISNGLLILTIFLYQLYNAIFITIVV